MPNTEKEVTTFSIPPYFVPYENKGWAKDWLAKHNVSLDAKWPLGNLIRTDVRNNRLVFLCYNPFSNEYVDAVGRSNKEKPKWLRYGTSRQGFYYNGRPYNLCKRVVVVEDALSAVCISHAVHGVVGYALMGTSMSEEQRAFLAKAPCPIIICLDRDAQDKALKMRRSVSNTMVYMPKDDLKYGHTEDIEAISKLINNC